MKKIISILLITIILLASASCTVDNGNTPGSESNTDEVTTGATDETTTEAKTETPEPDDPVSEKGYILINEGESVFDIVRPENRKTCAALISSGAKLYSALETLSGGKPIIRDDFLEEGQTKDGYEILIGDTNREETVAEKAKLAVSQFAIVFTEKKIVIVGSDETLSATGVLYFIENYLIKENVESGEGKLILKKTDNYHSDPDDYTFRALLKQNQSISSTSEYKFTVSKINLIKTSQGGGTDGKYFYQALIQKDTQSNEKNNIVRIVKTDLATGKVVKISEDLDLNHANDITYNSKIGKLVVAHNNPYRDRVSFVDPDTLEVTETRSIGMKIYCIAYNATYDRYVVGLSGGQTFTILDSDFKKTMTTPFSPTSLTTGYITQGMECDDQFIYFVLYKNNVITVYDWSGNFVSLVKLDITGIEPENIFIYKDELYVGCGASAGTKVYKITLTPPAD